MSCGVGCRGGLDPALLWLWSRPAATAPTGPLAWEPLYVMEGAQKKEEKQKKKKKLALSNIGEDVECLELSSIAGGDAKSCSHFRKWFQNIV